jgi:hypothetical protein
MRPPETGEARARRLIRQLENCVRRGVRPLRSDARLLEMVGVHRAQARATDATGARGPPDSGRRRGRCALDPSFSGARGAGAGGPAAA